LIGEPRILLRKVISHQESLLQLGDFQIEVFPIFSLGN
jgi:hypothetical protein